MKFCEHLNSFVKRLFKKKSKIDKKIQNSQYQYDVDKEDYIVAHKFSINHRKELIKDKKCGCFYCVKIFSPSEIKIWIEDPLKTAICPYCGIDSVIGEYSGYPITQELLQKMHDYWF